MGIIKKILFFFNATERKQLAGILFCVALMGMFEIVGLAIILPFLAVVTQPSVIETNNLLASVYQLFNFTNPKQFILFLGTAVFTVLVAGNAFSAMTTRVVTHFCYQQGRKISLNLVKKYVSRPYGFYLNRNSTDLAKNIIIEVDRVVVGVFINSLQFVSKCFVIVCIFGFLLMVDPKLALAVSGILGGAYITIYGFIRKKLADAGKSASEKNTVRYNVVLNLLKGIKDVKILGREQKFYDDYDEAAKNYVASETLSQLLATMTRYFIEAIAFGGMVLIALYLIQTKSNIAEFMPLLGLYALAGYRLMPSMQQLFTSFASVRYHLASLNIVYNEMSDSHHAAVSSELDAGIIRFEHQLRLNNIRFQYEGAQAPALNGISLEIPRHSITGVVGASGAGKTTLIDTLLGLLVPDTGAFTVDDKTITPANVRAWQKNIGYVPQHIFLLDDTIAANIAFGIPASEINHQAVMQAAQLADIHHFVMEELPKGYQTTVGEAGNRLSGGQRQRIAIARALYHDPELLIFDEATSALDNTTETVIMAAIQSLAHRKTIILIAHRLNTVKNCDLIYVLNKGKIVAQGRFDDLLGENHDFQQLAKTISTSG